MITGLEKKHVKEQTATPEIAKIFRCRYRALQLRCRGFEKIAEIEYLSTRGRSINDK